ncbi:hypothetical protein KC866_02970 [Patescibacteria group bacterium]|nr:hypothetical protein [Patescibacteria group bacterium]
MKQHNLLTILIVIFIVLAGVWYVRSHQQQPEVRIIEPIVENSSVSISHTTETQEQETTSTYQRVTLFGYQKQIPYDWEVHTIMNTQIDPTSGQRQEYVAGYTLAPLGTPEGSGDIIQVRTLNSCEWIDNPHLCYDGLQKDGKIIVVSSDSYSSVIEGVFYSLIQG